MSMQNLLQTAQSEVASQIKDSFMATNPSSIRKFAAAGMIAMVAMAATFSTGAHAQFGGDNGSGGNNFEASKTDNSLSTNINRGSSISSISSTGGDVGRLLGANAGSAVKSMTGQNVNLVDFGGSVGKASGAIAGVGYVGYTGGQNVSAAANAVSDSAGRIGSMVGNEIGRGSSMGSDVGRLLGVSASTAVKALTGQNINGADVGGTIGQVAGAIAGLGFAGGKGASSLAKSVGVVAGGTLGAVAGGIVGKNYDQNHINDMTPAILINSRDQQSFLTSMQIAGKNRQIESRQQIAYHQNNQINNTNNLRPGTPINPEQAGFQGYLAQSFSRSGLPLTASGSRLMPEQEMVAVAQKAMEVVKVGKAYGQATQSWDAAFVLGESPAVKNQINVNVVNTDALMKAKMYEYTQSRNAAAAQGYDVRIMDGAIAQELPNLKPQNSYGFQSNYRAPQMSPGRN